MSYVQHTEKDIERMLAAVGSSDIDELFGAIPGEIRLDRPLDLPAGRSEAEILAEFEALAARNVRIDAVPSFLGGGVYQRFIPAAVDYLSSRGEFSTAYTPYQPEVSQGTLQAVFEYQTMIARLTNMDISNASMYEGGTALAEAVLMAFAVHGKGGKVLVSGGVNAEYRSVLSTYVRHHPIEIAELPLSTEGTTDVGALGDVAGDAFAVVLQSPNFFGIIEDGARVREALDALGPRRPLLVVLADPISLALLKPPGSYAADIAIGDGQPLGNDPSFGGPTFGFFATRKEHVRKIPGRIVGQTVDRDGRRGYVLTFQTREQHIRRERATSNICTNQGLCCLRGAMYMALLGPTGLRRVAELSTRMAHYAAREVCEIPGVRRIHSGPFFQEFAVELPMDAAEAYTRLLRRGVRGGLVLSRFCPEGQYPEANRQMLLAATELTTVQGVKKLRRELAAVIAEARTSPGKRAGEPRIASDTVGSASN